MNNKVNNKVNTLIIGAGASGIYSGYLLQSTLGGTCEQQKILCLEKSRGVGGRLATRRLYIDEQLHQVDLGGIVLQAPFRSRLLSESHQNSKVDFELEQWEGELVLPGASNRLLKALCEATPDLVVQASMKVDRIEYNELDTAWSVICNEGSSTEHIFQTSILILAIPAPQALVLLQGARELGSFPIAQVASVEMACRWTWVFALKADQYGTSTPNIVKVIGHDSIETIYRVSHKPGVTQQEGIVTIQVAMRLDWSEQHAQHSKEEVANSWEARIIEAVSGILGARPIAPLVAPQPHKWLYAHPRNPLGEAYLHNERRDLWCIGDWVAGYGVDDSLYSAECAVAALERLK